MPSYDDIVALLLNRNKEEEERAKQYRLMQEEEAKRRTFNLGNILPGALMSLFTMTPAPLAISTLGEGVRALTGDTRDLAQQSLDIATKYGPKSGETLKTGNKVIDSFAKFFTMPRTAEEREKLAGFEKYYNLIKDKPYATTIEHPTTGVKFGYDPLKERELKIKAIEAANKTSTEDKYAIQAGRITEKLINDVDDILSSQIADVGERTLQRIKAYSVAYNIVYNTLKKGGSEIEAVYNASEEINKLFNNKQKNWEQFMIK